MNKTAPIEIAQIGLDPSSFKFSDERSWRGPCPVCGGHRRFVLFTDHDWPLYNGYCDQCGHSIKAWENVHTPINDEQRAQARAREADQDQDRKRERATLLAKFTTSELWNELHKRLTADHRLQWQAWGVPDDWQDYLELGFVPDKSYYNGDGEMLHTPAYTIPFFHNENSERVFRTMQYRLFDAPNPADRYRFEHGLESTYYMTTPNDPIGDEVIICEGAKKAAVTRIHLFNGCVLGVPAKGSWGGIVEAVKKCGRVSIVLDPDATAQAVKMAKQIGKAARVIVLPDKIDDLHTHYGMELSDMAYAIRYARIV